MNVRTGQKFVHRAAQSLEDKPGDPRQAKFSQTVPLTGHARDGSVLGSDQE